MRGELGGGIEIRTLYSSLISAIQCQLLPPGGNFGKNPFFLKEVFKKQMCLPPAQKGKYFLCLG